MHTLRGGVLASLLALIPPSVAAQVTVTVPQDPAIPVLQSSQNTVNKALADLQAQVKALQDKDVVHSAAIAALETRVAALEKSGCTPVNCTVSAWSSWASVGSCTNNQQTEQRTRTVTTPASCGGTCTDPLTETRVVACGMPPSGNVLSPSDFTYLGMARLPLVMNGGTALTARVDASGAVQAFLSIAGEKLYEYQPPTSYSFEPSTAPRVGLVRDWGYYHWNLTPSGSNCDVADTSGCWKNQNVSWDDQGVRRNVPFHTHGIVLKGDVLYRTFLDFYNSLYGGTDFVLAVTDLRVGQSPSTGWAKAPWRVNANVKTVGGNLIDTPEGLGMIESFGAISRNTDNSHGPCLSIMPYPPMSTPGGFGASPLATTNKLCYSIGTKAPRANDFTPDVSNPFNPDEPGKWTQVDRAAVGVYIVTSTGKRGYLVHAGLGTGQIWYGHYDEGPNGARDPCRSSTRGENAQGYRPEWRIYDPQQLTGGHVNAAHTFDPRTLASGAEFDWLPCKQYVTGGVFDRVKGLLYLIGGFEPGTASVPLLHVWRVN